MINITAAGYDRGGSFMGFDFFEDFFEEMLFEAEGGTVALIIGIICSILLFIFVLPQRRRDSLNGFWRAVADIVNMKVLFLEFLLKFVYTTLSICFFIIGLIYLFKQPSAGLLLMFVVPLLLRVFFEAIMSILLLVKNVSEINTKMGPSSHYSTMSDTSTTKIVSQANTTVSANSTLQVCSKCGKLRTNNQSAFCQQCGHRF